MCLYLYVSLFVKVSLLVFLRRIFVKRKLFPILRLANSRKYIDDSPVLTIDLDISMDEMAHNEYDNIPSSVFYVRVFCSGLSM